MDAAANNQRVASALFRAGLLDEASIRRALDEARGQDLAALLVRTGRVRPDDLQRALARPSGVFPTTPAQRPSGRVPAQTPGPPPPRASGVHAVDPALDLTIRTGPPPAAPGDAATDLTLRTGPPATGHASGPPASPFSGSSTGAGSSPSNAGGGSILSTALGVAPGEDVPPGTQLGPYVLRRLVAKGGMGAVFVAEHTTLRRTVALKVLLSGDGATEEQLQRFLVEARTSSKLTHPNVVPVYEVGEANGVSYMTMELVEGPSLRQLLRDEGPLPPRRALHLVEQVARGVAAAHAEKIVHRDLKPHNVLVAPGDVAKVMDFGLAKETDQAGRGLTVSGALLGTPSYMAPEQAAGERVGPLADVYGLGATLYECLTGKPPFEGATLANIITKVLNADVVAPRQVRPAIHPDVETICLKALEKDPRRRYPSARALADDMARWLAGEAIQARPLGRVERLTRWARRNKVAVLGATTAAVAALSVGGWLLYVPHRLQVLAAEQQAREDAAQQHTADAFVARVQAAHADLARAAAALAVRAEEAAAAEEPEAARREVEKAAAEALASATAAARALAADWDGLDGEVRRRVGAQRVADRPVAPPFVVPADRARLWATVGAGYERAGALAARDDAFASAFEAGPTSAEGEAALARVLARDAQERESPAWRALLDHLLSLKEQRLPADLRDGLRVERARRRIAALDLRGAAADLSDVDSPVALELKAFLRPLLREVVVDLPGPPDDPLALLRVHRDAPGGRAELELGFRSGAGGRYRLELQPEPRLVPILEVARPTFLAPGHRVDWASAGFGGSARRPLAVYHHVVGDESRIVLADADGRPLGTIVRTSRWPRVLRFVELDDDPETAHAVCVMGPNAGDSVLVRVDAAGNCTAEDLDPEGRSSPRLRGAASFVHAVAVGRTAAGPRLVLGYGAWAANNLRVLREEGGRLVLCHPEVEVGIAHALELLPGTPARLIAVHAEHEEVWRDHWTSQGIAAYALDGDRVVTPAQASQAVRPSAGERAQLDACVTWRTQGGLFAIFGFALRREGTATPGRLRVARLVDGEPRGDADLLVDEVAGAGVSGAGDLLGAGTEQLVVAAGRQLRLLGVPGDEAPWPAPPPATLDDTRAAQRAPGLLMGAGLRKQALRSLLDREEAAGVTRESELLALDVLDEEERAASREAAAAAADARAASAGHVSEVSQDLRDMADDVLRHPDRTARARSATRLLLARHHLRSSAPEQLEAASDHLASVDPGALDAERRHELEAALSVAALRAGAPTPQRDLEELTVDFTALPADAPLLASDPVCARLEPGRGLVVRVNRRVPLLAGVPLVLPLAPFSVTLDCRLEGRTWRGRADLGLLQGAGGPLVPGAQLEGVVVSTTFWEAVDDLRRSRFGCDVGLGRPAGDVGSWHGVITEAGPLQFTRRWPHLFRSALQLVIEHDPTTRRSHVRVVDREREGAAATLCDGAGHSRFPVPWGRLLAGVATPAEYELDHLGQGLPPEATLVLERVHVRVARAKGAGALGLSLAPATVEQDDLTRERVGGRALALALDGAAGLARVVGDYERLVARAAPEEGARLLVQRADVRARHGDVPGARGDLARALELDAFGCFRALEDDGRWLSAPTAAAVSDLLRDALPALDEALARRPDDPALLGRRAIVRRLRGELPGALDDLARADAAARGELAPARVWVRTTIAPDDATAAAFAAVCRSRTPPERPEFLRTFWAPRGADDPARQASQGLEAARSEFDAACQAYAGSRAAAASARLDAAWDDLERWTAHALDLAPDPLARATLLERRAWQTQVRWQLDQRREDLRGRAQRDLEAVVDHRRATGSLRGRESIDALKVLALHRALTLDTLGAARALREAMALGLQPGADPLLQSLDASMLRGPYADEWKALKAEVGWR